MKLSLHWFWTVFVIVYLIFLLFSVVANLDGYWTGGHYVNQTWVWSDGSPIQYSRWATSEPDNLGTDPYLAYIRPERWYSNFEWASHNSYVAYNTQVHGCGIICEIAILG